jgi:hypothetical protein
MAQPLSLPYAENKFTVNVNDMIVRPARGTWQLWAGTRLLREFGEREADARDALVVYRDLHPTEWVTIGPGKPIVEYGLVNGRTPMAPAPPQQQQADDVHKSVTITPTTESRPFMTGAGAKHVVPIDMRSVRVEPVRGVWCLRDDYNIHINFGADKADADQSLAAVRRYGFNRLGLVGTAAHPAMSYFFAMPETGAPVPKGLLSQMQLQSQMESMVKVGIPVGGVGFVGEMLRFEPRALEVRREGNDWVIASGQETIGRFGPSEWVAKDTMKAIADARFTEFCKVGSCGLTFFLTDGRAPSRVPFNAQGRTFDVNSLQVRKNGDHWIISENSRHLFDCASQEEGETLIRVLQYYKFDQLCHLGPSPKVGVSFLAKTH